jgi:RNA polymerase sigma factor (sigma-70 family)
MPESIQNIMSYKDKTGARFENTSWNLVMAAVGESPAAVPALDQLCQKYLPPLYAFLRRKGCSKHEAEDLTQGFIRELLAKDRLRRADRERGKFRSFLLAGLQNYARNEWKKRPRAIHIPIGTLNTETHSGIDPIDDSDPVYAFEKEWAMTLISQVRTALECYYAGEGKAKLFSALVPFLTGEGADYGSVAANLEMPEGTVRVAVHRLRKDYRKFLRAEVGRTLDADADEAEIDEEIRYLIAVAAQ